MSQTVTVDSSKHLQSLVLERFGHEPTDMLQRRLNAAEQYFGLDWPRLERTPLKKRRLDDIPIFSDPPRPKTVAPSGHALIEIRLDNNYLTHCSIPNTLKQKGLILEPLNQAIERLEVRELLGTLTGEIKDRIGALNQALWHNGVFLSVPANLEEPVEVSIEHRASDEVRALITRNLIVVGHHSRLVVTQRLITEESSNKMLLSEATEIIVEDGGKAEFDAIQQCATHVEGFIRRLGQVNQDAVLDWNIGEFGSSLSVSGHESHLARPGAATRSTTVFFGSAQQHQDYTAKSFHQAPHTTSNMIARGVMKDRARSIFTGLTQINQGARGSDGRQKEETLMLSDESRADAIPSLVIDERDVYAAHAASAGPVDRGAIFYLTSRGLSEQEAIRLIVHGFLAPVIDRIPHAGLRDEVWAAVERKIRE